VHRGEGTDLSQCAPTFAQIKNSPLGGASGVRTARWRVHSAEPRFHDAISLRV
jgi:hypothetical protein